MLYITIYYFDLDQLKLLCTFPDTLELLYNCGLVVDKKQSKTEISILISSNDGSSSNSSGYSSGMGMILEESSETGGSLLNMLEEDGDDFNGSTASLIMEEPVTDSDAIQGVGAVDLFIDDANPLNRAVHSSLGT